MTPQNVLVGTEVLYHTGINYILLTNRSVNMRVDNTAQVLQ